MLIKNIKTVVVTLTICGLFLGSCGFGSEVTTKPVETESVVRGEDAPVEDVAFVPTAEDSPPLRPITLAQSISDPGKLIGEYMSEGVFISHFDTDDIDSWQGYSQDTEITVAASKTPPEGYINSANWHAKQTDKWVQPTAGFQLEESELIFGDGAGRWSDTTESTRIVITDMPTDWSGYMFLTFWAYSAEANDAGIEIAVYSELDSTSTDDYFKKEIVIDWEGWRLFEIPLHEFLATRKPVGWNKIDYVKIASSGWGHEPEESTDLIFDEMKLSNVRIGPKLAIDLPSDRVHPYLFVNANDIDLIRNKKEQYPWAKRAFAFLQAGADKWLNRNISVPETGGGFYHDDDDAAYAITELHYDLADGARDLALMYQFTGDEAYLEKSKEILLAYADSYLTYEIHDSDGRTGEQASAGGRATSQGINEARWVIPLAWAYDLIFNELSDAEKTVISDRLLRPVADLLMSNNEGRHNHQTWYNSGVGVIGFVLDEKEYVWYALLKDDSSLGYQLEKSITADGMWYEGSMHYQFYVLRAIQPLMEATHQAGFNVYENPNYKALFDFVVTYADPTLRLPTINDGRVVDLTDEDRASYFETAYNRFRDPLYVPILAESDRTSLNALLYGVPELGESVIPTWATQNYSDSKLAVLRSGTGDDSLQAVLNYMGYQGGHSHADQLSLVLYGANMTFAPDAGSIKYRLPEQEGWFKQTLAHNTLVVDRASQERAKPGQLNYLIASGQVQIASVSSDEVYPGVSLERILLLNDDYLIDLFSAESAEPHVYDWVYHGIGQFSAGEVDFTSTDTSPGDTNGYQYLKQIGSATFEQDWQAEWKTAPRRNVRMYMIGEPGTIYYSAQGLIAADVGDEIAEEIVPVLIARRELPSTQFVSIIQPYAEGENLMEITDVSMTDGVGQPISPEVTRAMQIVREAGTDLLILGNEPGIKKIDNIQLDATWAWLSQTQGELKWLIMEGSSATGNGWAVSQEDLGIDKTPVGMGVFIEVSESGHVFVQNTYEYVTYVTLEGFMDSAVQIIELKQDGSPRREIEAKKNDNALVKFLVQPGYLYEVVGQ